jgi:hypothetical protein
MFQLILLTVTASPCSSLSAVKEFHPRIASPLAADFSSSRDEVQAVHVHRRHSAVCMVDPRKDPVASVPGGRKRFSSTTISATRVDPRKDPVSSLLPLI